MRKILFAFFVSLAVMVAGAQDDAPTVKLTNMQATMYNGLLKIRIGSNGCVSYMKPTNGVTNVLSDNGIYFSTSRLLPTQPLTPTLLR